MGSNWVTLWKSPPGALAGYCHSWCVILHRVDFFDKQPIPPKTLHFSVPGEPLPQLRPRATSIRGKIRLVDPTKSRNEKKRLRSHFALVAQNRAPVFREVPLKLELLLVHECPEWEYRKRFPRLARWWDKKPDASNIVKLIEDAGNGILFDDDSRIVELHVRKVIGAQGEPARIEARLTDISNVPVPSGLD